MSTIVPENYQSLSKDHKERFLEQLAFAGQKGWYYEEFGQLFIDMMKSNGPMADFRGHIRRLDDTPDRFGNGTIARGLETIDYPYLSILGILTPDDLLPYAKRGSALWGDGFLARFFLVAPDPDFYSNEQFPRGLGVIPASLIDPLKRWHEELGIPKVEISGTHAKIIQPDRQVLRLSEEVFSAYYAYDDGINQITRSRTNHDLDGNYARFPEKALRMAALFASLSGSPTIEMNHWARAQMIAEHRREELHILYSQLSENLTAQKPSIEEKVLRAIRNKRKPVKPRNSTIHQITCV